MVPTIATIATKIIGNFELFAATRVFFEDVLGIRTAQKSYHFGFIALIGLWSYLLDVKKTGRLDSHLTAGHSVGGVHEYRI